MQSFSPFVELLTEALPRVGWTGLIEIAIISVGVYGILRFVLDTRAGALLKGLLIVLAFVVFCRVLQLNTLLFLLSKLAAFAVTALVIIFQPELRRALEQLGGSKNPFRVISSLLSGEDGSNEMTRQTVEELVNASFLLGRAKTGALMVLEREDSLKDIVRTGIDVDGIVTSQLLINIFEKNTPLHDGAVVIRRNRVLSATAYLPLSENREISKALGTRHRAAIGISEVTDSLTIVVSEETGHVSVAQNGRLQVVNSPEALTEILVQMIKEPETHNRFGFLRGKGRNERPAK